MEVMAGESNAIDVSNLNFSFSTSDGRKKPVLFDINLKVSKGSRVLIVGPNGAGKSTLLRLIAGKSLTDDRDSVIVLGKPAFFQTLGVSGVSFLGNSMWTRPVAFVSNSVPYEADIPAGEMMLDLQNQYRERREELVQILDIDLNWKLNQVSDGQRRRIQIMLGLLQPFKVLLIDEFTVDLDVLGRHNLMEYLRKQTETRECTILYCTHIFDGLDDWPTHTMFMGEGRIKSMVAHPLPHPLYRMAMNFMLEERNLLRARLQLAANGEGGNHSAELQEEFGGAGYSAGRIVPSTQFFPKNRMNDYRFQ